MKRSTFNNLGKQTLRDMVFTLYELGFSRSSILELLAGNSSDEVNQFLAVDQKIYQYLPQEEHCYQNRIRYLAKLCIKSESETMMRDEKILKDFLWELLGFRDLNEYATGLIAATYYFTHVDVPEHDMPDARLAEMILGHPFINNLENRSKYFNVKKFITEYLTYIYQQSVLDCPEWKYGFPSCIGELRMQMAQFIAQTKDQERIGAGLVGVLDELHTHRTSLFPTLPLEQLG